MKEKTLKIIMYAFFILMPLLPTIIVLDIIGRILNPVTYIIVALVEYFGFQYIIALFVRRLMQRLQHNKKQKENLTQ